MKEISTGNKAIAKAVKQALPGVVAAYPITPQTEIVETIADYVTSGQMKSRYIPVESEHSAMAACIGASITGIRTFTATSAHGLLYMHEMTNWAAGARLPIVMANVNRSLGPGWNIWAEHTDAMQERDTGWLQVYVSTVQEAYDTTLMAFRIAEHNDVLLPVMVNLDGFSLSHIMQPLDTVEPGDFIPPLHLPHAIDTRNPTGYGGLTGPDQHFRFRWDIERSMRDSVKVIAATEKDFRETVRPQLRPDRELPVRRRRRDHHRHGNVRERGRGRYRHLTKRGHQGRFDAPALVPAVPGPQPHR